MAQGALTKFGIDTANPVTKAFEALSFSITSTKPHLNANGLRGTRSHIAERTIEGVEEVAGSIVMAPNPEELALLLPWIGFAATGTTFNLTEGVTSRYITADKVTKVPTYSGCYVNRAQMRAVKNAPWEWTFDVIGQQETVGDAASFPAISITETPPLALHHSVLTLLGSARSFSEITVTIDNALEAQANNAAYNELIETSDRMVMVDVTLPYTTANLDLLRPDVAGDDGTLVFTYGNYSCTFTFGILQFPRGAVEVPGKSGLMLRLSGQARMTGSTRELVIVLDSTP
jgi:hypothetical protein